MSTPAMMSDDVRILDVHAEFCQTLNNIRHFYIWLIDTVLMTYELIRQVLEHCNVPT